MAYEALAKIASGWFTGLNQGEAQKRHQQQLDIENARQDALLKMRQDELTNERRTALLKEMNDVPNIYAEEAARTPFTGDERAWKQLIIQKTKARVSPEAWQRLLQFNPVAAGTGATQLGQGLETAKATQIPAGLDVNAPTGFDIYQKNFPSQLAGGLNPEQALASYPEGLRPLVNTYYNDTVAPRTPEQVVNNPISYPQPTRTIPAIPPVTTSNAPYKEVYKQQQATEKAKLGLTEAKGEYERARAVIARNKTVEDTIKDMAKNVVDPAVARKAIFDMYGVDVPEARLTNTLGESNVAKNEAITKQIEANTGLIAEKAKLTETERKLLPQKFQLEFEKVKAQLENERQRIQNEGARIGIAQAGLKLDTEEFMFNKGKESAGSINLTDKEVTALFDKKRLAVTQLSKLVYEKKKSGYADTLRGIIGYYDGIIESKGYDPDTGLKVGAKTATPEGTINKTGGVDFSSADDKLHKLMQKDPSWTKDINEAKRRGYTSDQIISKSKQVKQAFAKHGIK